MIDGLIFLVALTGFTLLLLSMRRHQHDWLCRSLSRRTSAVLRLAGFLLLVLAFVIAGASLGWAYGAVSWFGWLTLAAAAVVVGETGRHRLARKERQP